MFRDPLGRLVYQDGAGIWRCKCCLRTRDDGHKPICPIARVLALLHQELDELDCPGDFQQAIEILEKEPWR